jgi:16S rRNA (guanine1207-N2)-methyltransferase
MFKTSSGLFSPERIDKGTLLMLSAAEFDSGDKILDLGCGYGAVGITAAKIIGPQNVVMSDNNKKAVSFSQANAELNGVDGIKIILSDGFNSIQDKDFTVILSNPPYHSDFSVPKHFIEKGFNRLILGGKMYMVTKRKSWYKNKFISVFGGVKIIEADGYFVFCAEKRGTQYAGKAPMCSRSH